jgi:hypothetical protein
MGLLDQSRDQTGMAVAKRRHRDSTGEIEITATFGIEKITPLPPLELNIGAGVDRHDCRDHGLFPNKTEVLQRDARRGNPRNAPIPASLHCKIRSAAIQDFSL